MTSQASWQLDQLQRIGQRTPERLEELLSALWNRYPNLLEELAIMAADEGQVTVQEVAELLLIGREEAESKLAHYHSTGDHRIEIIDGVAKLVSCQVAVWEVARESRKGASVNGLANLYPSLPMSEIKAALRYAEAHPEEVNAMIEKFELVGTGRYIR